MIGTDPACADYGAWTGYRLPEDRSNWHPAVRCFFDYWQSLVRPGRLPGRQHVIPEQLARLWPRLFLLDIHRNPLRFRYRLVGTEVVWSRRLNPTGQWLDVAHPDGDMKTLLADRLRFMAETGIATWRRGPSVWDRYREHHTVENCLVPLAGDGRTVDMIFAVSVIFDSAGRELRGSGV